MNNNTIESLTPAEVHRLKYPKAQIVNTEIFKEGVESNMVDEPHLSALKKALRLIIDLEVVLQNAEDDRSAIMGLNWSSSPNIDELKRHICMCEQALKDVSPAIVVANELLGLYECNLGLHPRHRENTHTIKAALEECKSFFEEYRKKIQRQIVFIERADMKLRSKSNKICNPRHVKPRVVVAIPEELTYPYDRDLTRSIYDFLTEYNYMIGKWDVFNNAVMSGNYAQLNTRNNAKAHLCQIIHLFDIYICGGLYGHIAANSIGLNGRTNLTQQMSNLPENFKLESERIFKHWAKLMRNKKA